MDALNVQTVARPFETGREGKAEGFGNVQSPFETGKEGKAEGLACQRCVHRPSSHIL